MKKNRLTFVALFCVFLILPISVFAQKDNSSGDWIRVQSNNGEFSVEVPAKYTFVADKNGFWVADSENNYLLEEVKMYNTYYEKTLLSFESYRASKKALNCIKEQDEDTGKSSEIRRSGFTIRQILTKNPESYTVRQYISTKDYIYVLTAASRTGETPAIKRFLDSLSLKSADSGEKENNQTSGIIPFSALKVSHVEIDENPEPYIKPADTKTAAKLPADKNYLPILVVNKQAPSYLNDAREKRETGIIQTRLTFSEEGNIPKVGFLKTLKYGLVRQAFFAALRIKFLPAEKNEKPVTVTNIVEYSFRTY